MSKPKQAPKVPNNLRAKKEGVAFLDDASKGGGGNGGVDGKGVRVTMASLTSRIYILQQRSS